MLRLFTIAIISVLLILSIALLNNKLFSAFPQVLWVSTTVLSFVAVPICLLHLWKSSKVKHKSDTIDSISQALERAELRTTEYCVHSAAMIEESEDEGAFVLLSINIVKAGMIQQTLNTPQTLVLMGQYLYDFVDKPHFPAEGIRLFHNRVTGRFYGFEPFGKKLAYNTVYEALPLVSLMGDNGFMTEDGEVYDLSIEAITDKLGVKAFNTPSHSNPA
jgi:hypothetical protein